MNFMNGERFDKYRSDHLETFRLQNNAHVRIVLARFINEEINNKQCTFNWGIN